MPINLLHPLKQIFWRKSKGSTLQGVSGLACAIAASAVLTLAPSNAAGDPTTCGNLFTSTCEYPTVHPTFSVNFCAHDGYSLATDVYLKGTYNTRRPVLVIRGQGARCAIARNPTAYWPADANYHLVVQDIRDPVHLYSGNYVYSADQEDGQTLLEALDDQTWSQGPWPNGHTAMLGLSNGGIVDYLAAPGAVSSLRGIAPSFATGDLLNYGLFNGGVLHREVVDETANPPPDIPSSWADYVGLPIWDGYLIDNSDAGSARVAGLHVGGWFDVFGQGMLDSFSRLQTAGGGGAWLRQKIVIGPWLHGGAVPNQIPFPSPTPSNPSLQDYNAAWKQCVFQDNCTAWNALAPVRVYHMGASPGSEWKTYAQWPPPAIEYPLYFASGGSLSSGAPPRVGGQVTFTSNPDAPCPTRGGTNNLLSCAENYCETCGPSACGPYDQRPIEARSDVVVFTSGTNGATIVGRIHADVWIKTDLPDVDVFVRMTDVYPNNGPSMLMAQGIQRARYRNGTCPEPLANEPTLVRVDLSSTALVVPAGHKVRVIVSASAGPNQAGGIGSPYSVNPQNGDEYIGTHPNRTGSINVLFGGDYASALVIPVPTATPVPDRRPNTTPCPAW